MPLEIKLHTVPHFKAFKYDEDISGGQGMVGLLRSFVYCQITLILLPKTADWSSIYWNQRTNHNLQNDHLNNYFNFLVCLSFHRHHGASVCPCLQYLK